MLINLLSWIVFGLIVGGIARLLVPGRDPMGCLGTMALGIVGSLTGGFLGNLLMGRPLDEIHASGFIFSIIGGIVVLLLVRTLFRRAPPRI